jgi:hypothetical protein
MTKDEILSMEAGEKMDALIAEKVMGIDLSQICDGDMYDEDGDHWSCTSCSETGGWGTDFEHTISPKHYSTYIAAAWKVVEKLELSVVPYLGLVKWHAANEKVIAFAAAAPLAICRAALLSTLKKEMID